MIRKTHEHMGIKIPIDKAIFSDTIIGAIKKGNYERREATEVQRIVEPGERVLEIGGGIGFVSAVAALDPRVEKIVVFEANPLLMPVIAELHEMNGVANVDVVNGVLMNSTHAEAAKFYVRQDFWSSSLAEKPWGYERAIDVPTYSFSEQVERIRPTLIVCDIEGGELNLFENANLSGVKKVLMEVHQEVIGRDGMKKLFDSMSSRGFHYDQWHSNGSVVLFSDINR